MKKYYTRACNFYYGNTSKNLIKRGLSLPLCGNKNISFDKVEITVKDKRKISSKIVNLKEITKLPIKRRNKIYIDIKNITSQRKHFNQTKIMGILNMTPDSFSDGGKYNQTSAASSKIVSMINSGADIIDIGGESTRPGSKIISQKDEWNRIAAIVKKFKKKHPKISLSIDTRKSEIMSK